MLEVLGKLRILYDFTAADSNQLSVHKGDVVLWNQGSLNDDWILCSLRTKVGWVPSSYVQVIERRIDQNRPSLSSMSEASDGSRSLGNSIRLRWENDDKDGYASDSRLQRKCIDSLRFVEVMKPVDKFEKGDLLQIACITDKEVEVVYNRNIVTIPKSCCILTSKALPGSDCVSLPTIRELLNDSPLPDMKPTETGPLSLSQSNSMGYQMCIGFDEEVSQDPQESSVDSLRDNGFVPSHYPLQHW